MTRPRLLDLFCGAGGAAMGYSRAGFDVVGVDINPQPHYPFEFHQADALEILRNGVEGSGLKFQFGIDAIHASPPCNDHSLAGRGTHGSAHLLAATVELVKITGLPWIVENVVGPTVTMDGWWFVLCGSMFGLSVRRHRRFGASFLVMPPQCDHKEQGRPIGVYGSGGAVTKDRPAGGGGRTAPQIDRPDIMGMPWATPKEATQAIPPAYTEFIGGQLLAHISLTEAP